MIPIHVRYGHHESLKALDPIPVYDPDMEQSLRSMATNTALVAVAGGVTSRAQAEAAYLGIARKRAELARLQSQLQTELAALQKTLQSAKERVWMLELYLGSNPA